jgi:hypothetical protein
MTKTEQKQIIYDQLVELGSRPPKIARLCRLEDLQAALKKAQKEAEKAEKQEKPSNEEAAQKSSEETEKKTVSTSKTPEQQDLAGTGIADAQHVQTPQNTEKDEKPAQQVPGNSETDVEQVPEKTEKSEKPEVSPQTPENAQHMHSTSNTSAHLDGVEDEDDNIIIPNGIDNRTVIPTLTFKSSGWCEELKKSYFRGSYKPQSIAEYDALKPYAKK